MQPQPDRRTTRLADILEPDANSFGVMRFLLATAVLVSHSYMFAHGTAAAEPLKSATGYSLGQFGVQLFFVLSGLLVAQSFDRSRSAIEFLAARGLRIFPALVVCVALTVVVIGPLVTTLPASHYFKSFETYAYVLRTLSLSTGAAPLPAVFETLPYAGYVNSSLWTLKYESICYVLLCAAGLAGLFNKRFRVLSPVAVGLVAAAAFLTVQRTPEAYSFADNLRYFAVFFSTGVFAYLIRDRLVITVRALPVLAVLYWLALGSVFQEPATAAVFGYAMLVAATQTWGPFRAFCNRYDASYGIYIYAGPVQQSLLALLPGLTPVLLTAIAFAIVFPMALVSWIVIERPALRARTRLFKHSRPVSTVLRKPRNARSPRLVSRRSGLEVRTRNVL